MLMHIVSLMHQIPDWMVMYIPNSFYLDWRLLSLQHFHKNPEIFDQFDLAQHFLTSVFAWMRKKSKTSLLSRVQSFGCASLEELFHFGLSSENWSMHWISTTSLWVACESACFLFYWLLTKVNAFLLRRNGILWPKVASFEAWWIFIVAHILGPFIRQNTGERCNCWSSMPQN